MITNKFVSSSEDIAKVLETQLNIAMSGSEYSIERKKVIVCGQLQHCVEIKFGKDNGYNATVEVNKDTGFGLVAMN